MVADFVDCLSVLENLFLFSLLQGAANFQWIGFYFKFPNECKEFLFVLNAERIAALQGTFGQGEVMDAVQYIRFSAPIPSQQAIDLRAEYKLTVKVVLKLNEV
jgi:hypothetical protein